MHDGLGGEVLCHYLEMSNRTLGESAWFPEKSQINAKEKGVGYGKANTYLILKHESEARLTVENCAAYNHVIISIGKLTREIKSKP